MGKYLITEESNTQRNSNFSLNYPTVSIDINDGSDNLPFTITQIELDFSNAHDDMNGGKLLISGEIDVSILQKNKSAFKKLVGNIY